MKIADFKTDLRDSISRICAENGWTVELEKHRGMAFENWCFELLSEKYPSHDNTKSESIIRTDDAGIDIVFEARDTQEVYIIQCKHPKIAASNPIPDGDIKHFFSNFELMNDKRYTSSKKGSRIQDLANELPYWIDNNFLIYFIFASTGQRTESSAAISENFNRKYSNSKINVRFEVWGLEQIKDLYVEVRSVEESYPESIILTLADAHYMSPQGALKNVTFAVRGTELQKIARSYKESLFNWNIRRYLGKKGEINQGVIATINGSPQHFYYYNNGISALCDDFELIEESKCLKIRRMQIVNGAQTIGAIQHGDIDKLKDVLVLVKLTAIKHFVRETGIAAELIRTNNTQNKLSVPDFRSNDKIQLWLEQKFKDTKTRGSLLQIDYGRKKPYPRSSINKQVLKLQDLGKIRYAWLHDPRIPIADPASLFVLTADKGLYGWSFGCDGSEVEMWTEEQFKDTLLAIHSYNKLSVALQRLQEERADLKQITRLKYYALKLFKKYLDRNLPSSAIESEDLYRFGSKFDEFYSRAEKLILLTLEEAYKEIINNEVGTAFSLPRDEKVWLTVQTKFETMLRMFEVARNFA